MARIDTHPLENQAEVKIGNNVYIIERHFESGRTIQDAVYEAIKNEAKRDKNDE